MNNDNNDFKSLREYLKAEGRGELYEVKNGYRKGYKYIGTVMLPSDDLTEEWTEKEMEIMVVYPTSQPDNTNACYLDVEEVTLKHGGEFTERDHKISYGLEIEDETSDMDGAGKKGADPNKMAFGEIKNIILGKSGLEARGARLRQSPEEYPLHDQET